MAGSVAAELRQLAELHEDGRLTDAEFSTAKALVLQLRRATDPTPPAPEPVAAASDDVSLSQPPFR